MKVGTGREQRAEIPAGGTVGECRVPGRAALEEDRPGQEARQSGLGGGAGHVGGRVGERVGSIGDQKQLFQRTCLQRVMEDPDFFLP